MNVLDVMDHAIRCVHQGASPEHAAWHAQLTEARAAVAELIEAAQEVIYGTVNASPYPDSPCIDRSERDRLKAALARVGAQ